MRRIFVIEWFLCAYCKFENFRENFLYTNRVMKPSGSVVECLTRDRGAAGSSLTGVTALWSLSKTHLS